MRIATRKVMNIYKHKGCKMRTTEIKITTTKRVVNNCNKKRGKGR
jgi:hypothetical protein